MGKVKRGGHAKKEPEPERTFRERYLSRGSETFKAIRDLAVAAAVMLVVIGALWWYAGTWPPVVVIESGSMMHDDDSSFQVIDTGDIVVVKSVGSRSDVRTYVEGEKSGYETYSDYGDVIVYRPLGKRSYTPVIHRAILWLEVDTSSVDEEEWTMSVPSLDLYGYKEFRDELAMYGLRDIKATDMRHSGFITRGDNNFDADGYPVADQHPAARICPEPVKVEWIDGVARGEMPWFGLIKLWATGTLKGDAPRTSALAVSVIIVLLIVLPVMWDILGPREHGESYIMVKLHALARSLGIKRK